MNMGIEFYPEDKLLESLWMRNVITVLELFWSQNPFSLLSITEDPKIFRLFGSYLAGF